MKKLIFFISLFFISHFSFSQNVGIGTTFPHGSAALEVKDNSKGVLIPRMTSFQRASIANPAEGLMVYQTDETKGFWFFNGSSWVFQGMKNGSAPGEMMYWNGTEWITIAAGQQNQGLFFCNGAPTWGGCKPVVNTDAVTSITASSAVSGGSISDEGSSPITAKGVVWGFEPNPTIDLGTKTVNGTGPSTFSSNVTSLNGGTTYYIRAYATNNAGTSYGNELIFQTLTLASVTTNAATSITSTSATSGGTISSNGGNPVTERGIVWGTTTNLTVETSNKIISGSGNGSFVGNITGLTPFTNYFAKAYAITSAGTAYGNTIIVGTFPIGANYAGGIIAYVLKPGDAGYSNSATHGIIAAPSNQSNGAPWGCCCTYYGTSNYIGTGNQNTQLIVSRCNTPGIGARICNDLVLNGYSDWYLPSYEELLRMLINKNAIGNMVTDGVADAYMCSTEDNAINVPTINFACDYPTICQGQAGKGALIRVRAVRSF